MNLLRGLVTTLGLAALLPGLALAQGFHGIYTQNGIDVWAAGDNGTVYRSLDRGANWMSLSLISWRLNDVAAVNFTVLIPGVDGRVLRSGNSGGDWTFHLVTGVPNLYGVAMPSETINYVVGADGAIAKSIDAGLTWNLQTSGSTDTLRRVRFTDTFNGWVVGDGGTVLKTDDGGVNWTPVVLGTVNDLRDIAVLGDDIWIVGERGTAFKSDNGGTSWTQVNLKLDAAADVNAVCFVTPDSVVVGGGGGFIRISADGGANWTFSVHQLHGRLSSLCVGGGGMWATTSEARASVYSVDGGATWDVPNGMSVSHTWVLKHEFFGGVRGHAIDFDRSNPDILFAGLGADIYKSTDAGETWLHHADFPSTFNRCNALLVSPYDADVMCAAVSGNFDQVLYTDDGGQNWSFALGEDYGEYGIPLEMHPDKPDTLYFGGDTLGLYRSIDFGQTWTLWGADVLQSPCDIIVVPDSSDIVLVGDGITGSGQARYLRSTNAGVNFSVMQTQPFGASEIPGMACSRLRSGIAYGTNWGSGGVQRSSDFGATWPTVHMAGSAWGIDVARDDPNCVVFGTFAGLQTYLSVDGGDSFTQFGIAGANYSFFARDRGLVIAQQSNGLYKLKVNYNYFPNNTQSLALVYPVGGETLSPGSNVEIQWTQTNMAQVQIEYRPSPSDTFTVLDVVPGYSGSYTWEVPFIATTEAQVRLTDGWDGDPFAVTAADITIALPLIAVTPADIDFGNWSVGGSTVVPVTIENTGTAPLTASSIQTSTTEFVPGRSSLSLAPGASDTVGVLFEPSVAGMHVDTLDVASDAYNQVTWRVPLYGESIDGPLVLLDGPNGGQVWQYNTVHDITWQAWNISDVAIEYRTDPAGAWNEIVASTPAAAGTYAWTIPNSVTEQARVRVRDVGGGPEAISAADFSITVPRFALHYNPMYLPQTLVTTTTTDSLQLNNPGTAPLIVSSIVSDNPNFWPGRSGLVLPAGTVDTIGVSFSPMFAGPDSANFMITADDPFQPHVLKVYGYAVEAVAVGSETVTAFGLRQNQPNPFGRATSIRYSLPIESDVLLEVFNLQGQRVAKLFEGRQQPGNHTVTFGVGRADAAGRTVGLPAGVYFYRLKAGGFVNTRKMLLVR